MWLNVLYRGDGDFQLAGLPKVSVVPLSGAPGWSEAGATVLVVRSMQVVTRLYAPLRPVPATISRVTSKAPPGVDAFGASSWMSAAAPAALTYRAVTLASLKLGMCIAPWQMQYRRSLRRGGLSSTHAEHAATRQIHPRDNSARISLAPGR